MIARRQKLTSALGAFLATTLGAIQAFADQATVDVTTSGASQTATSTTTWYASPWIWAAAVGVFLIIVIALTSRGSSSR